MSNEQRVDPSLLAGNSRPLADYRAQHFLWQVRSEERRVGKEC